MGDPSANDARRILLTTNPTVQQKEFYALSPKSRPIAELLGTFDALLSAFAPAINLASKARKNGSLIPWLVRLVPGACSCFSRADVLNAYNVVPLNEYALVSQHFLSPSPHVPFVL